MLLLRDQVTISSDNLSPIVSICSIVCLLLSTLTVAGRVFTKAAVVRRLAVDDFAIVFATMSSIGQTVAVLSASAHGLGRHWDELDQSHKSGFEKATYASGLLFILTTILVKISIIQFLGALAPIQELKKTSKAFGIVICLWGIGSFLAATFQCSVPMVWQLTGNTCFDIRAFSISFDAINILTELALILWPTFIIIRLHASKKRRIWFIAAFGCRILVVIGCLAQMIYSIRVAEEGDLTFDLWPPIICMEIVQCVSLTTACIPYLQPFLLSLESGFLWGDDYRRSSIKNSSYASRKPSQSASSSQLPVSSRTARGQSVPTPPQRSFQNPGHGQEYPPAIAMLPLAASGEPLRTQLGIAWDSRSGSSQVGLTENIGQASVAVNTRRRELEGY